MTPASSTSQRHLVPTWRSFSRTLSAGEIAIARSRAKFPRFPDPSAELRRRLAEWRQTPSIITAAEVVETAFVEGLYAEAIDAARALVAPASSAMPLVKRQATLLLERAGVDGSNAAAGADDKGFQIAKLRERTRDFPQDAIAWVELALAHINEGHSEVAKRAIIVALQLAPHNRYVLRSAARLFVHLGDEGRAYDLLLRNDATRHDPWLIASEIAVSKLAGHRPRFLKIGTSLLEDNILLPRQVSELAGAIATTHLFDDNTKTARKFFRASLIDPTANSLAQAEWASPRVGDLVPPRTIERVQGSFEAKLFQDYWSGNLDAAIEACEMWSNDEPFSTRPYQFGSGICIAIDRIEDSLAFIRGGLSRNPDDVILMNNQAFCYISIGKIEDARALIGRCMNKQLDNVQASILIATLGFAAMRGGNMELGVEKYREAIRAFTKARLAPAAALAKVFFAREAARAGLPDAAALIADAREAADRSPLPLPEASPLLAKASIWLNAHEVVDGCADFHTELTRN